MKKYLLSSVLLVCACVAAQTTSPLTSTQYKAAKDRIEAEYKTEKTRCDALQANAEDLCEAESEGRQKVARAELEQQYKPSTANARKVAQARIEADYELAKEKCDELAGEAEDACEKSAEAQRAQSRTALK